MSRNKIMTVNEDTLKIFVANMSSDVDTNFRINMKKIQKTNYHFGILLNKNDNLITENSFTMPYYYPNHPLGYYLLDIVHKISTEETTKQYRFIFINIHYLAHGMFSEDDQSISA